MSAVNKHILYYFHQNLICNVFLPQWCLMNCVSLNDSWRLFRLSSQSYSNSDPLNKADAGKKPNQLAQYFIIISWKREFELFFLIFGCLYFLKHKYLDDLLARKLNLKETSVVLSCTSLSWKRWVILAGFQTTERCCFSLLLEVCLSYGLISEKKQNISWLLSSFVLHLFEILSSKTSGRRDEKIWCFQTGASCQQNTDFKVMPNKNTSNKQIQR